MVFLYAQVQLYVLHSPLLLKRQIFTSYIVSEFKKALSSNLVKGYRDHLSSVFTVLCRFM